jgi:hypothetical protein
LAAAVLDRMRAEDGQIGYLQPALAWLDGWLAEQRGDPGGGAADLPTR